MPYGGVDDDPIGSSLVQGGLSLYGPLSVFLCLSLSLYVSLSLLLLPLSFSGALRLRFESV